MVLGGIITCIFVSVLFFLFSFLIWKKKDLSLISAYNEQTFKGDKHKLAKGVGIFLLIIGLLILILPFALEFSGNIGGTIVVIMMIIGIIGLAIYINFLKLNDYEVFNIMSIVEFGTCTIPLSV